MCAPPQRKLSEQCFKLMGNTKAPRRSDGRKGYSLTASPLALHAAPSRSVLLQKSQKATPRPRGNVPGAAQGDRAAELPQILSVWCLLSQPRSWAHVSHFTTRCKLTFSSDLPQIQALQRRTVSSNSLHLQQEPAFPSFYLFFILLVNIPPPKPPSKERFPPPGPTPAGAHQARLSNTPVTPVTSISLRLLAGCWQQIHTPQEQKSHKNPAETLQKPCFSGRKEAGSTARSSRGKPPLAAARRQRSLLTHPPPPPPPIPKLCQPK